MRLVDRAEIEPHSRGVGKWAVAVELLAARERLIFALLIAGRVVVGICDLLVAAAMYLLFLLLQGRAPVAHFLRLPQTTLSLGLVTAVLVIVRALMDLVSARLALRQIQNLHTELFLRLVRGYSEMQWSRFAECNRSELANHAIHTAREAADFYHRWIELIAAVVIVAMMAIAVIYQSPIAACGFGMVLLAVYGLHRFVIRTRLQTSAFSREESLRVLQRNVADMLSSGKEIRTYRLLSFFCDRVRRQAQRVAAGTLRTVFLPQIARVIADQGAVLLFLGIIVAVQLRHGDARQLLSLLAFYFVLSRRLLPLISQISLIAGQMDASYENVRIVASELEECHRFCASDMPVQLPGAGMVLELSHVNFFFSEAVPILQDLNLRIREGEIVVLRGVSGIGKSSLLNLIAGVSHPQSGVVRVDRTSIAYVPQEAPLLDDSIRNNLLFGLSARSDEELTNVLASARLDTFVAAQPLGLETSVGDNGALLSGGQRQRLGLARALLRGGNLLLVDEATSAIDEDTERQILDTLRASGKSVLLVAHRARTQRFADRVLRLQGGCLLEQDAKPENDIQASVAVSYQN